MSDERLFALDEERSLIGVELRLRAEWECNMVGDVTDREVGDAWLADLFGESAQHAVEPAVAVGRIAGDLGELPERDAGDVRQAAAQVKLGEHALDAVNGFEHVVEHEDGAVEIPAVRCADERGHEREVSAAEPAARPAADERRHWA